MLRNFEMSHCIRTTNLYMQNQRRILPYFCHNLLGVRPFNVYGESEGRVFEEKKIRDSIFQRNKIQDDVNSILRILCIQWKRPPPPPPPPPLIKSNVPLVNKTCYADQVQLSDEQSSHIKHLLTRQVTCTLVNS